ncbi:MAG: glycosyltransferase family 4 protein [Vicinamibacteria bacterium]|nr:glycosyltransferase family 4 protein [Vicinamibacteria bacterium]
MIDGYNLGLEKGTGVATYARNLSYCLHSLGHEVGVLYGGRPGPGIKKLMKEIAFFDSNVGDVPLWLQRLRAVREAVVAPLGYEATQVPLTGTVIYETFRAKLPYFDSLWNAKDLFRRAHAVFYLWRWPGTVYSRFKPDLMHWTYPLPLRLHGTRNIYTLHDLVPLRLPYTTLDNKRQYLRMCTWIARSAAHIVTVSETSRRDIINVLGVDPNRVTNTYQAVSLPEKHANKPLDIAKREVEGSFGLTFGRYFIFFGALEPKKNLGRLIEAYLGSGVETPLVIVGAPLWKSEQDLALLYDDHIRSLLTVGNETRVKRRVIRLDYVPFPLLLSLIRGARATLFPSLYEGFGLPVLESMLLGTPVLSSNVSSIPEVAGDAARLVDPYDTFAIAQAIRELDENADLRAELSHRGARQAAMFGVPQYEARLREVYSKVMER